MLGLYYFNPTKKELRKAVMEIEKILDKESEKSIDGMAEMGKPRKETLSERVDVHKGRLDRQGRDIHILWKRMDKIEKRLETEGGKRGERIV